MHTTTDDDDGRPTAASAALVVLVTALAGVALTDVVDLAGPATVGAAGGVALTAAFWAVGRERRRTAGHFLASLLALPVGLGLAAATAGAGLVLVGATFPVSNAAALPTAVVDVFARAALVFGVVVGAFGAVTAAAGVLRTERVRRTTAVALRTSLPPFVAATALTVLAVLDFLNSAGGTGPGAVLGDVVNLFATALFTPEPTRPHLGSALLFAGVALVALDRAVRALPLAELATGGELTLGSERLDGDGGGDRPDGDRDAERTGDKHGVDRSDGDADDEGASERNGGSDGDPGDHSVEYERLLAGFHRWASGAGLLALALFPVGAFLDLVVPADVLRSVLTPTGFDLATAVTTVPLLRTVAWWTAVGGGVVYAVARAIRRLGRSSTGEVGAVVAPLAAGTLLTGLAWAVAVPVVDAGVDWAVSTLPGELGRTAGGVADAAVAFYGEVTIVVGVTSLLLVVTASAVGVCWLALRTPYLDPDTAAVSLAGTGLFQASVFAAVVGASNVLVVAGLVAALLAWDQGTYGLVLAREVGRARSSRRTELTHATSTLAVGGVGAALALGLARVGAGLPTAVEGAAVAVLVVAVGLALLVVALR